MPKLKAKEQSLVSNTDDRETVEKNNEARTDDDDALMLSPESSPEHASLSGSPPGGSPPRATRSGEGGGGGERHERDARSGFFARIGQFIRETRAEMRRVSWPTTTEVKNTTIITIIAVVFFALFFFAVDHSWTFLLAQLERLITWLVGG